MFDQNDNPYVELRATAITYGVPGTIYRYASQQPGGLLSVFKDPYGFLNATTKIYVGVALTYSCTGALTGLKTQHLAVSAQANYLGTSCTTIPARLTSNTPRLFVE
jgi:hypothetical protein